MLNNILNLTTETTVSISNQNLIICTIASLLFGLVVAGLYMYKNTYSKNFVMTLALLPAIIQIVITLVNGNLGTGVAVLGAFSLVRFRSIPGSAREIGSIFLAMALGLATGMGYVLYAAIFLVLIGISNIILATIPFGETKEEEKELKVTIPENLDYAGIFDDLFETYTKSAKLIQVRTTNMGSMYELKYRIFLKNVVSEKAFIDEVRCRNGNLNIICGKIPCAHNEVL